MDGGHIIAFLVTVLVGGGGGGLLYYLGCVGWALLMPFFALGVGLSLLNLVKWWELKKEQAADEK